MSEHDFLRRAVALASDAVRGGSEPFGSLIVRAGTIIAEGTPEDVSANPASFTGQYLRPVLEHTSLAAD